MTSSIASSAHIGNNTKLGKFCVIADNVHIGDHCQIGNHVVIHPDTVIQDHTRIDDHTVIGKHPLVSHQSSNTKEKKLSNTKVQAYGLIGSHVTIYRGCQIGPHCLIADLATVREDVTIGEKTIIGRGVAIENQCQIGSHCKLQTNVYITAFSKIGHHCFIAPGVCTSNDTTIGRSFGKGQYTGVTLQDGGRIGVQATILPGLTIETEAVVAAGAVLTKDASSKTIFAGVPAKKLKAVPNEQLLKPK